jgi:hypothetical protein
MSVRKSVPPRVPKDAAPEEELDDDPVVPVVPAEPVVPFVPVPLPVVLVVA